MHRRLKSEKVTQFRGRTSIPEGEAIGTQLAVWARSVFEAAVTARPEMPESVEDGQADAWEPLLVVADLAGGEWPKLARETLDKFFEWVQVDDETDATGAAGFSRGQGGQGETDMTGATAFSGGQGDPEPPDQEPPDSETPNIAKLMARLK